MPTMVPTICTKDRSQYFGEIVDEKMILSPVGIIADLMWYEIKHHAKNVKLGEHIIMPDHMHGILILTNNHLFTQSSIRQASEASGNLEELDNNYDTNENDQPKIKTTIGQNRFQNQGKNSVSSIIGSYKSAVTKHCNRLGLPFGWQASFYDHIIRDTPSFERIQQYIIHNPKNWRKNTLDGNL